MGASAWSCLVSNFTNLYTGSKPTFSGTNGGYEAVGGYGWSDYATAGRKAFRCFVSNAGQIALRSKYTNNGYTWTVIEVNTTNGTGNILISTFCPQTYPDYPETNGNLIPVNEGSNNEGGE